MTSFCNVLVFLSGLSLRLTSLLIIIALKVHSSTLVVSRCLFFDSFWNVWDCTQFGVEHYATDIFISQVLEALHVGFVGIPPIL